jgi:hypothetical protein
MGDTMTDPADTLAALAALPITAPPPPSPATARPTLPAIIPPPSGVLSRTPPQRDYLAWQQVPAQPPRGVIGRGQLHMLAGEGGAGKGRWTMALAVALAAAPRPAPSEDGDESPGGMSNVVGLEVAAIGEHERVLLLLGEDDQTDFWQRCQATALEALSLTPQHEDRLRERLRWATAHGMPFSVAEEQRAADGRAAAVPTAAWESFVGELKREAEAHPWALIVIDPLARFGGVNENDNALQTQLMTILEGLTRVNGEGRPPPAVLVVDHTAKPDKKAPETPSQHAIRGASGKVNAARIVMQMMPGGHSIFVDCEGRTLGDEGFDLDADGNHRIREGEVTWHVVKNNGARKAESVALSFTKNGGLRGVNSEMGEARRERRKRQWHQAEKERLLEAGGKPSKNPKNKGGNSPPNTDDVELKPNTPAIVAGPTTLLLPLDDEGDDDDLA